jgi:hypothetical protein
VKPKIPFRYDSWTARILLIVGIGDRFQRFREMGEVTIEAMVLTVTPIQSHQGLTMIELVIGESFKAPVAFPVGVDREVAGVTIAVQKSLSQLPGFTQVAGSPRITLRLTKVS